jgi:hypothetical protein
VNAYNVREKSFIEVFLMKKSLAVLSSLLLLVTLTACPNTDSNFETPAPSVETFTQPTEPPTQPTEPPTQPTEPPTQPTEPPAAFCLAVDPQPTIVDGEHLWLSDTNLTFTFDPDDTWKTFAEKNEAAGFSIGKDFYGKEDLVYYTHEGTQYQIDLYISEIEYRVVRPDDIVKEADYAGFIPHRESIQTQWLYEVSYEPFTVEGYTEIFDRQGKTITLDVDNLTYTIKHVKLKMLTATSFISSVDIIATGSYTSDDGDTLGATLTFDNGYVMKTNRSTYYRATLMIDGESIKVTSADHCNLYSF